MYLVFLALHFLGLSLALGAGFASLTLSWSGRDLPAGERTGLALRTLSLSKNSSYGVLLLLLTGIGMMLFRGVAETFAWGGGAFHGKLALVVILLGVLGYSQVVGAKARRSGAVSELQRVRVLSRVQLVLGVLVVIAAVVAFK